MGRDKSKQLQVREKTLMDGFFIKRVLKFFFKILFKLTGWTSGPAPKTTGIVIGAPHTSNWDFLFGLGAAIIEDVKVYFSIKQSWCRIPVVGSVIMWLGAIPIDRSIPGLGQSEQIAKFVEKMKDQWIYFAFTPEGTRSKVEKWKTGFYHVAQDCQLPLHLAKLDYENKNAGIFHSFHPTGNKEQDIKVLQQAYSLIHGKNTEKQFPDYVGKPPEVSRTDAEVMKAMYLVGDNATELQIAARANFSVQASTMLDPLIGFGLIEKSETEFNEPAYTLTFKGKGALLHMFPELK